MKHGFPGERLGECLWPLIGGDCSNISTHCMKASSGVDEAFLHVQKADIAALTENIQGLLLGGNVSQE